ncbi:hypothetical protein L208DRAFT_1376444 [Tricholoma matsutake]|nr:hypothetical protein L208DRAFT_1376444 [Tricholoma matsutake 945]
MSRRPPNELETRLHQAALSAPKKPFVPSLDDTAPHPLDSQISSMELKLAIQIIESACAQLHTIINLKTLKLQEKRSRERQARKDSSATGVETPPMRTTKQLRYFQTTLPDPEWGHSYKPEHASFCKWSKTLDLYSIGTKGVQATPEDAKQGQRFGIAMIGWADAVEAGAIIRGFPWAELGPGVTVCDVGGWPRAYPTLQLKLQETPDRTKQAETHVWPKECPEAIKEQRIEFKSMDFLVESPIKGCDVYFFEEHHILGGVRDAMKPSSRVLIRVCLDQNLSAFKQAPEPLLSNYDVGKIWQYNLDLDTMVMLNSQESYLEQLAGLRFEKFWDVGEMGMHLV